MSRNSRVGVLAAVLALGGAGCEATHDVPASPPTSELRGGNTNTYRLKGLVDFTDTYNDRSPDLSLVHCSGIMLNQLTMLTSARCARRVMRPGRSFEGTRALWPDLWGWVPNPPSGIPGYYKHCAWLAADQCFTLDKLGDEEDDANSGAKFEKLFVYSLTSSPDNDLALVIRNTYYPATGSSPENFADIYMDDFTPASMPRLQLYGWGRAPGIGYPLPQPRTGTMHVAAVTPSRIDLTPDQVQACSGDEGGAWTIPDTVAGSAYEVVALESSFTRDPSTGCSRSGTLDHASRLRDKMSWIESQIGPCGTATDAAGHTVKRCYELSCMGAADGTAGAWDGCRGSGCSVCSEKVDVQSDPTNYFPHYFDHHRNCSRNTTCASSFYRCSDSCPQPTDADR